MNENCFWYLDGNYLTIKFSSGNYLPNAREVFNFIFNEYPNINGLMPPRYFESSFSIKFSRYPLDLIVVIDSDTETNDIYLNVGVEIDNEILIIDNFLERDADHIVINFTWFPFVKDTFKSTITRIIDYGISRTGIITIGDYLALIDDNLLKIIDRTGTNLNPKKIISNENDIQLNPLFVGILYPYQQQGYKWLSYIDRQNIGCILADEMGLGKTVQIIALLADHAGKNEQALIITPATLLENWKREINRFAPSIKTIIHQGPKRAGIIDDLIEYDAVVTSYDTAVNDRYMLKRKKWDIVIIDEAQAIKNPYTKRARSVKIIPRRSAIAITGTPIQNKLVDLWSITDFIIPKFFGSLQTFKKTYLMDQDSAKRLEPKVTPLLLRRKIGEVAIELPELISIPQPLRLDNIGSNEYNLIRKHIIDSYAYNFSLVMLLKLRMYCAHRSIVFNSRKNPSINSVKYNRLLEILDEIFSNNERALIFTSWQKMVDILLIDIPDRFNIHANFIDGRTPVNERQDLIDEFNSHETAGIMVLNPVAGGVGLNITGANHVIHYNLEWNPAVVDQATARAYRTGQKKPVRVHMLYYIDTVEEIINDRLSLKREIADIAVVGVKGEDEEYKDIMRALGKIPKNYE